MKKFPTHHLLFLLLLFFISSCTPSTQNNLSKTRSKNNKPVDREVIIDGKCYGKTLVTDKIEKESYLWPIYTGSSDALDENYVESKILEISAPTTKWIKKKADKNCLSKDPDDCLVWCLVEVPGDYKEYLVVKDTSIVKAYDFQIVEVNKLKEKGGYVQMEQVVCKKDINEALIGKVCTKLLDKGYGEQCNSTKLDSRLKSSLTQYQRAHKLPVGKLDLKTLEHLGVNLNG